MPSDRRLLAALLLSLLAHALLVGSPGWQLPRPPQPSVGTLLEAQLLPPPLVSAPAQPPAPAPARQAPPRPAPPPAAPAPPLPSPAHEMEAPPVEQPAEEAAGPAAAEPMAGRYAGRWPKRGRIRFLVMRGEGEQGMVIGESVHLWEQDGERYVIRTETETTGLVALFHAARIVQTSQGVLGAQGLEPQSFSVERQGRVAEGALFDRAAGRLVLTRRGAARREVTPLAAGSQDLVSQIYQIGRIGIAARTEFMIATGRSYGRYAFEAVGDETLATPFGELRTWHVRTPALPGEQAMELWLAEEYHLLPVRIRFIDRQGDIYDQQAVEMEIDGMRLGGAAPR